MGRRSSRRDMKSTVTRSEFTSSVRASIHRDHGWVVAAALLATLCIATPLAAAPPVSHSGRPGFSAPGGVQTEPSRGMAVQHGPAAPIPAQLVEIVVTGLNDSELQADVLASLQSRPFQPLSRQAMEDDLERLQLTGLFSRVTSSWQRTPQGWVWNLDLSLAPKPMVMRGQSPDEWDAEPPATKPAAQPKTNGSKPAAKFPPVMPVAAEDLPDNVPSNPFMLDEPLAEVRIEGNVTIETSEISKHIKTRPGRVVTQKMIKDDVDQLVRTRWFATVDPHLNRNADGLVLIFRVLERPIVKNVEYRGCRKIKQEKLEALTNLRIGSPYDVSANRECARRIEEMYHEKGFAFATVELERGNDKSDREVIFVITEGPKVKVADVDFQGNEYFSDGILALKLQTKKRILWAFSGKYDPATIPDDIEAIKAYYHSLGFFDVVIDHELKFNDDRSLVTIVYQIQEGARFKIRNVDVMGANVISEAELRQDYKITPGEFYNAAKVGADVDSMREKYGRLGRLFAKIDAVPGFTEEPGVVDILYKIDEDKVYRVREINVHIAGDHPHTKLNLARNISLIHPGDLADPKQIQRTKRRLEGAGVFEAGPDGGVRLEIKPVDDPTWLQSSGMSLARGQSSGGPNGTNAETAEMGLSPVGGSATPPLLSGQAHTGSVESTSSTVSAPRQPQTTARPIRSNTNPRATKAPAPAGEASRSRVRNYFVEPPSDDELAVIRAQNNILLTQSRGPLPAPQNYMFDNDNAGDPLAPSIRDPDPNVWDQMPPPEFIDIDAYLAEARTGRLMFGVGVNSNAGVIGNIVLSENNFDIMRPPTSWADIMNGTAWRGGGEKFRIEAMPGTQVSRYLVDWQNPYFLDTDVNLGVSGFYYQRFFRHWTEDRLGGRVRLGRQFTQTWSGNVALRGENVNITNIPSTSPQLLLDADGSSFLSTVRVALMHDTRDAAFNPSEGHYVELGIEQAFGEFDFTKYELEGRQYFTTYKRPDGFGKHIVTLFGQAGWTGDSTPIYERFFAGGFQSFRGFAFRGVTPLENNVEIGGQFQFLGSVEYMLPVTANEFLKVVGFTDFGTVENNASFENFRVSVGAGLRVTVPGMGPVPIALDWAVPIIKTDFDRDQLFSFYVGINR
jgi:outer membrane protein insertion porin family